MIPGETCMPSASTIVRLLLANAPIVRIGNESEVIRTAKKHHRSARYAMAHRTSRWNRPGFAGRLNGIALARKRTRQNESQNIRNAAGRLAGLHCPW